ncbi:hypothetical protein EON65_19275 [archaeon]|nr:MAG: hypothetical protein EON65_19275 [archaeon]
MPLRCHLFLDVYVYVYAATIQAAVVDHEHVNFQRLELLPHQVLSDHEMASYRSMIHAAKHMAHTPTHASEHTHTHTHVQEDGEQAIPKDVLRVLKFFPKSVEDSIHTRPHTHAHTHTYTHTDMHVSVPHAGHTSGVEQAEAGSWLACGVCGLDVTWPFILHSEASRALVTNTCR